jgi:hypothetical protein
MIKEDIEIIGISTCGTYPSWISHTVASFYNHVDKIVVVNGGYNIDNPTFPTCRLEREHKQLEEIDIHNKIIEYTPTEDAIKKLFTGLCKIEKDECGRSGNMTFSNMIAYNLPNPQNKKRWVLKLDSDQILYQIKRDQLLNLIENHRKTGFRFAQYADYHDDFEHISPGLPGEFTNDGSLFYRLNPNQRYSGQGSPGGINVDQHQIYDIRTSHMRRIVPPDVDKYEYYFKRYWYHTYGPNSIMEHDYNRKTGKKLTLEEVKKLAHDNAISTKNEVGVHIKSLPMDERIPYSPPLVCKMTPLEYIKKGY